MMSVYSLPLAYTTVYHCFLHALAERINGIIKGE